MEAQKEKYGLQEYIDRYLDNYELAGQLREDLAQKFSENNLDFSIHSYIIEECLLLDSDMNITVNFDRLFSAYHPSGHSKSAILWDEACRINQIVARTVFKFCYTYPCWNFENIHEFEAVIYG